MDVNSALQILGVIVESFAAILGIVSMFYVFILQRFYRTKKRREKELVTSSEKMFWWFFGNCVFTIGLTLIFMWLTGTKILSNPLELDFIVVMSVLASILGLISLALLIRLMVAFAKKT